MTSPSASVPDDQSGGASYSGNLSCALEEASFVVSVLEEREKSALEEAERVLALEEAHLFPVLEEREESALEEAERIFALEEAERIFALDEAQSLSLSLQVASALRLFYSRTFPLPGATLLIRVAFVGSIFCVLYLLRNQISQNRTTFLRPYFGWRV